MNHFAQKTDAYNIQREIIRLY